MKYHLWGDEDFDWNALYQAEEYLWRRCRQFGRLGIWTKEKYGTLRVSTTCAFFTYWPIHNLVKPGHVSYRWPRWFMKYVDWPLGDALEWLGVSRSVRKYQLAVLKHFWLRAAKKWPQVADEILAEYEWYFPKDAK